VDKRLQPQRDRSVRTPAPTDTTSVATDWRGGLPPLTGDLITLRELRASDAPTLFVALTTEAVSRFVSPPPASIEGFEKYIAWSDRERAAGAYAAFGVVPHGGDTTVGLFYVRALAPGFENAEWGFALASDHWGSGMFVDAARLAVRFAFEVVGVHRLEARAAVANGRANGALRKMGAFQECVLRNALGRAGEYQDQALWTILREEWHEAKDIWGPRVILH
jgi:RimJ/RimL family protein N-acetyltransferase